MKQIVKIELKNIDSFKDHPFKVQRDDSFNELKESIKENGLLEPLLVRLKDNGRYELISGHRRKLALELNWITEADCYVEELNVGDVFLADSAFSKTNFDEESGVDDLKVINSSLYILEAVIIFSSRAGARTAIGFPAEPVCLTA